MTIELLRSLRAPNPATGPLRRDVNEMHIVLHAVVIVVICDVRRRRRLHLHRRCLGPHVERPRILGVERDVHRAQHVLRNQHDARGHRLLGMRYGNVHRCVESPDLCDEVPVPWSGNILLEGKFDIRDDGPGKENRSSHRELITSAEVATIPVPCLYRELALLYRILIM
jgi:hypothetical protein